MFIFSILSLFAIILKQKESQCSRYQAAAAVHNMHRKRDLLKSRGLYKCHVAPACI